MIEASSEDKGKKSGYFQNEFDAVNYLPVLNHTYNPLELWIHIRREKYITKIKKMQSQSIERCIKQQLPAIKTIWPIRNALHKSLQSTNSSIKC